MTVKVMPIVIEKKVTEKKGITGNDIGMFCASAVAGGAIGTLTGCLMQPTADQYATLKLQETHDFITNMKSCLEISQAGYENIDSSTYSKVRDGLKNLFKSMNTGLSESELDKFDPKHEVKKLLAQAEEKENVLTGGKKYIDEAKKLEGQGRELLMKKANACKAELKELTNSFKNEFKTLDKATKNIYESILRKINMVKFATIGAVACACAAIISLHFLNNKDNTELKVYNNY